MQQLFAWCATVWSFGCVFEECVDGHVEFGAFGLYLCDGGAFGAVVVDEFGHGSLALVGCDLEVFRQFCVADTHVVFCHVGSSYCSLLSVCIFAWFVLCVNAALCRT